MSQPHRRTAYGKPVRYDRFALEWVPTPSGPMYVTPCCDASAKGMADGIGCRSCYELVDAALGGIPEPLPEDDTTEWKEARERFDAFIQQVSQR